ncbi:organic solute transporter ostalpha domain-containing protein [Ditylenchus destructor]|nr:organic solute transporter ostalpha domain-containing protein [Ditylenchus destructor]
MVFDTIFKVLTGSLINCTPSEVPQSKEFLLHLPPSFIIALTVGTILSLTTLALGILHLLYIGFYVTHLYRRAFILYLAGTAPFVSVFATVAMFMPRIWFLATLLSLFYFSIALYVIICLLLHIVNGRQSMVKKMTQTSSRITVQTPPFCCVFPCLPQLPMEARKIRFCELMVMQTPCVRLVATIVSLVLYFEYQGASLIALKVLDFIALPSLLIGIYGCHILVTTVTKLDELSQSRYIVVFRLLDIYFAFFGLQQPIFDFLARAGIFGCGDVLPALDTAFFWKNFATVCESFFVSVISTILLKPSRSALFDKYPSCRSIVSTSTITTTTESRA